MRRALALIVAGIAAAPAGCGSSGPPETPASCLSGTHAFLRALREAPGPVKLRNSTAISGCLTDEQDAGEIASVGSALLRVATTLNARGRRAPGGEAPVELGYLLGAVERGAARTGGIHQDLVRRIEAAARFAPGEGGLPAAFRTGFGQGLAAGQASG